MNPIDQCPDDEVIHLFLEAVKNVQTLAPCPAGLEPNHLELPTSDHPPNPVSFAELARSALALWWQDPKFRVHVESAMNQPPHLNLDLEMVAGVTAALVVLQSQVRLRRNESGKWIFDFEKKALSDIHLGKVLDYLALQRKP